MEIVSFLRPAIIIECIDFHERGFALAIPARIQHRLAIKPHKEHIISRTYKVVGAGFRRSHFSLVKSHPHFGFDIPINLERFWRIGSINVWNEQLRGVEFDRCLEISVEKAGTPTVFYETIHDSLILGGIHSGRSSRSILL